MRYLITAFFNKKYQQTWKLFWKIKESFQQYQSSKKNKAQILNLAKKRIEKRYKKLTNQSSNTQSLIYRLKAKKNCRKKDV